MLTCPACGRFDASRPARQVWDQGRTLVPRAERGAEEVLTPLARRVAPPEPPSHRWMLWLAAGSLLLLLSDATSVGVVAAPALVVLYAAQRVRNEAKVIRAQALWEQTWYCHGCDHVWVPGLSKRAVPSRAMQRMLWHYS